MWCFQDIKRYKFVNPIFFHCLNQTNFYELNGVSDDEEYLNTKVGVFKFEEQTQTSSTCQYFFSLLHYQYKTLSTLYSELRGRGIESR
jgi:hypothetical protein